MHAHMQACTLAYLHACTLVCLFVCLITYLYQMAIGPVHNALYHEYNLDSASMADLRTRYFLYYCHIVVVAVYVDDN